MKVCGAHPLTFAIDDKLAYRGQRLKSFHTFFQTYEMDFRLLLFPLVSVIFRYSQRVSAFYFDDSCKTVLTNFYMCFLLFRLRFLCLTFKMNHNALFIIFL